MGACPKGISLPFLCNFMSFFDLRIVLPSILGAVALPFCLGALVLHFCLQSPMLLELFFGIRASTLHFVHIISSG